MAKNSNVLNSFTGRYKVGDSVRINLDWTDSTSYKGMYYDRSEGVIVKIVDDFYQVHLHDGKVIAYFECELEPNDIKVQVN